MSSITDAMVLKHLKPLPNLKVLDISNCYETTHKGIATFGKHCRSLVHLKRNMSPLFNGEYSPIDDSEAKAIAATMVGLQHIELRCGRFSDLGISEMVTKCKSLSHFYIDWSRNVELGGDLMEKCERLEVFQGPWYYYSDDDEYFYVSEGSDEIDSDSTSD